MSCRATANEATASEKEETARGKVSVATAILLATWFHANEKFPLLPNAARLDAGTAAVLVEQWRSLTYKAMIHRSMVEHQLAAN